MKLTKVVTLSVSLIGGMALIGLFVFNAVTFIQKPDNQNNLSLFKLKTAFAEGEGDDQLGPCEGSKNSFPHPESDDYMISSQIASGSPATSSGTSSENGTLVVGIDEDGHQVVINFTRQRCKNTNYSITSTKYECERVWFTSDSCLIKSEYTEYTASELYQA